MKLITYTDGASRGNPGHSSYGFVIIKDGHTIYQKGAYIGVATNNVAEYTAVLEALKYICQMVPEAKKIQIFMDSKLVAEQLSGRYKIKSPNLKPIISKIKSLEEKIGSISYNHIPREKNVLADSLANLALDAKLQA